LWCQKLVSGKNAALKRNGSTLGKNVGIKKLWYWAVSEIDREWIRRKSETNNAILGKTRNRENYSWRNYQRKWITILQNWPNKIQIPIPALTITRPATSQLTPPKNQPPTFHPHLHSSNSPTIKQKINTNNSIIQNITWYLNHLQINTRTISTCTRNQIDTCITAGKKLKT
jgi:hypothetical protein